MKRCGLITVAAKLALSSIQSGAQQAQATATVANGEVVGIVVATGGGGYVAPPTVSVVGGGGYGALADAVTTNGVVSRVLVRNAGTDYSFAPAVIIAPAVDFADGLVGWWRGELNANDELGKNDGVPEDSLGYADGVIGKCFRTGNGSVWLGTNGASNIENGSGDFTVLTWAQLKIGYPNALVFAYPLVTEAFASKGWALWVKFRPGPVFELAFSVIPGIDLLALESASGAPVFADNGWHHVGVARRGDQLVLYYDGQTVASTNSPPYVPPAVGVVLGGFVDALSATEPALIDEVSIYNRALRGDEILAEYRRGSQGKYLRPIVIGAPQSAQWYWGQSNALAVASIGTGPLSYQWSKNGVPIAGATNATLTFAATQFLDGGVYTATVWNSYGSATTAPATVTVTTAGLSLGLVPKLTITGVTGRSYAVQYTTNLTEPVTWMAFTNLTLVAPVQVLYDFDTDATAAGQPQRFYRVAPGQP